MTLLKIVLVVVLVLVLDWTETFRLALSRCVGYNDQTPLKSPFYKGGQDSSKAFRGCDLRKASPFALGDRVRSSQYFTFAPPVLLKANILIELRYSGCVRLRRSFAIKPADSRRIIQSPLD